MGRRKLARRQDLRRQVLYNVQHDLVQRSRPSHDEVEELFSALDRNDLARLGVARLSRLELDHLYSRRYPGGRDWAPGLTQSTLLSYAAALEGRDSSVFALLRSGADPTSRWTSSGHRSNLTSAVRSYLTRVPSCFAVYIVKQVVAMRKRAGRDNESLCSLCERTDDLLPWEGCPHSVCEDCLWSSLAQSSDEDDLECFACRSSGAVEVSTTPILSKAESLALFLELPLSGEARSASSKPRFKGRSLKELANLYTGVTREQRAAEIFKAACAGKRMRLSALIAQGADIEMRNEYGITPLFAAVLEGHAYIARLLISHGADPHVVDNSGASLATVACATRAHDASLVDILRESGVSFSCGGTIGLSASDYLEIYVTDEETKEDDVVCRRLSAISLNPSFPDIYVNVENAVITELIPTNSTHPGAGSVTIDCCFTDAFIEQLHTIFKRLPVAPAEKLSCSDRSYYFDSELWVSRVMERMFTISRNRKSAKFPFSRPFPQMRYLHYPHEGGRLAPHVDLAKTGNIYMRRI